MFCLLVLANYLVKAQCTVTVSNLQHINCPNGGAVGGASVIQPSYINYSWQNITNGQLYNGGGGYGGTSRNDLDAGLYVITASNPYSSLCPSTLYSDTFEILESQVAFQFNPTQACPSLCNVEVTASIQSPISGVAYNYQFDSNPIVSLPNSLMNQCGGLHSYEIFANNISCGIENIGISQFAQMNLASSVTNVTCTQQGSATVNITGVGASAISTYCNSIPQYNYYTTINNILMVGDNTTISNNTTGICDTYQDYTSNSADVSPGSTYSLTVDLGTCHSGGFALIDIANVYVDWNIDGDFDDLDELVGQVGPTQSPSTNTLLITVPLGAVPGQSRMRVVAQNIQYQPNNQALPCDASTAWFGSTEDYTLVVSGSVATPIIYSWNTIPNQTTQTAIGLSSGTYICTITDANGCSASDTVVIGGSSSVSSVIASADQTICSGTTPNSLTASSGVAGTYSWSPASDFIDPNVQSPIFSTPVTNTTTYTVTFIESVTGCIATDDVIVTVNPSPIAFAGSSVAVCEGDSSTIAGAYALNNTGVNWISSGTGTFISANTLTPTYIPSVSDIAAGNVILTLTALGNIGCSNATSAILLTIDTAPITPPIVHN